MTVRTISILVASLCVSMACTTRSPEGASPTPKTEPAAAEPEPKSEPEAEPEPGDADHVRGKDIGKIGEGMSEQELRGCSSNDDCATTCMRDGDCCQQQCGCDAVYNKTFLAKLEAHQARCVMAGCAKAKCSRVMPYDAICEAGLCVSRPTDEAAATP